MFGLGEREGFLSKGPPSAVIAAASVAAFLTPPLLLPHLLGHSGYLFGTVAVLICALTVGPVGVVLAATAVTVSAQYLDRVVGIAWPESLARLAFYLLTTLIIAYGSGRLRHYQRASDSALRRLEEERALLQSMLDTGPDAMMVIDTQGVVQHFSSSAEAMFGWRAAEVVGNNVKMLMPEPYRAEHDRYIGRYLKTGERQIIGRRREVSGLRKDGSDFPMLLHVGEVRVDGETRFTGFVHDLTELNAAHDRANQLRSELTHVWRMNSLGEMAGVLSHELNQPLSAIANYLRGARNIILRLNLNSDDLIEATERASEQAVRAGEIIRRMRAMVSRTDTEHEMASLGGLIMEMDPIIRLVAREAGASLRYNLDKRPDEIWIDKIQMQQVIGNLVRNACEALADSVEKVVEIDTLHTDKGWLVRVEDSGPGVPSDKAEELFEPLTSTKRQGMGLGLSISRAIVESHKGDIWVERSRLGGASFCVILPGIGVGTPAG